MSFFDDVIAVGGEIVDGAEGAGGAAWSVLSAVPAGAWTAVKCIGSKVGWGALASAIAESVDKSDPGPLLAIAPESLLIACGAQGLISQLPTSGAGGAIRAAVGGGGLGRPPKAAAKTGCGSPSELVNLWANKASAGTPPLDPSVAAALIQGGPGLTCGEILLAQGIGVAGSAGIAGVTQATIAADRKAVARSAASPTIPPILIIAALALLLVRRG